MKVSLSGLRNDSPSRPLLQAFISYQGITDAAGAASGLTIVCGDLVNEPSYDGLLLKIRSGAAAGQVKPIYVQGGNTLTFATPWTNAAGGVVQITAGTLFDILSISAGSSGPGPSPTEGLSYYGVVDGAAAPAFTIGALAGLGAGKFAGATNPYQVFVLRDAGGASAAPQGEMLPVTVYTTATGEFTTAAFSADIAVGDEILILHPTLAAALAGSVTINNVFDIVNAILVLGETGGTLTTTGAVQTVYVNTTPAGVFEPNILLIDMTGLALGITVVVRTFSQILPGGALIPEDELTFVGPCDARYRQKKITFPPNRYGVEATLEQTAGAPGVDFDWAVFPKE